MKLLKNEEAFKIHPVGVRYKCEFCNVGEMIYVNEPVQLMLDTNPPLKKHKCNKCGGEMQLPKIYPYIEWVPDEEYNEEEIYGSGKIYDDGK